MIDEKIIGLKTKNYHEYRCDAYRDYVMSLRALFKKVELTQIQLNVLDNISKQFIIDINTIYEGEDR